MRRRSHSRRRGRRRFGHNPRHSFRARRRRFNPRRGGSRRRNPGMPAGLGKQAVTIVATIGAQLAAHKAIFGQSYQSGIGGAVSKGIAGYLVGWAGQRFGLISSGTAATVRNTSIVVALVDAGRMVADQLPTMPGGPILKTGLAGGRFGRVVTVGQSSTTRLDGFGRVVGIGPGSSSRLDGLRGLSEISRRPAQFSGFAGTLAASRTGRLAQF